jgi:hypothetical protein
MKRLLPVRMNFRQAAEDEREEFVKSQRVKKQKSIS